MGGEVMKRILRLFAVIALFAACEDPPPPEASGALTSRVVLAAGNVWLVEGEARQQIGRAHV